MAFGQSEIASSAPSEGAVAERESSTLSRMEKQVGPTHGRESATRIQYGRMCGEWTDTGAKVRTSVWGFY